MGELGSIMGGEAWRELRDFQGYMAMLAGIKAVVSEGVGVGDKLASMDWRQPFRPTDAALLFNMFHRMAVLPVAVNPLLDEAEDLWEHRKFVTTPAKDAEAAASAASVRRVMGRFMRETYLPKISRIADMVSGVIKTFAEREPEGPAN